MTERGSEVGVRATTGVVRAPDSRVGRGSDTGGSRCLEVRALSVAYPGGKALDDVSVRFHRGRVHAVAGENGAGKSTLIKVLSGAASPETGGIFLDGRSLELRSPAAAADHGIRVVHQELQLFDTLSVWENITCGIVERGRFGVRRRAARRRAAEALGQLGETLPLRQRVQALTPAGQQRVVIARALAGDVSYLILDEPTAILSKPERDGVLEIVKRLAAAGVGVIFVSHHLEETLELADDVSVLRDGRLVWTKPRADLGERELVVAMMGHAARSYRRERRPGEPSATRLRARDLRWGSGTHRLDLEVRAGELVAIVGLPGSDAETLVGALAGARPRHGEVRLDGALLPGRVDRSVEAGVGYVPADRKAAGLFLDMSLAWNVAAAGIKGFSPLGLVRRREIHAAASRVVSDLKIRPPSPARLARTLSGGNQQKGVLGRWLVLPTSVLLAEEPTRGVDVATKEDIYATMRSLAAAGGACVFYSSDLHEVSSVADRTLVLRRDGSSVELDPGSTADELYTAMSTTPAP